MEKAVKGLASALGVLATLATLIMMIAIVIDVIFRTLYDRSVPGVLEISETALVVAVFLGLAYTGATNSHIAVDLLTERLPARAKRWAISGAWTLTTIVLVWLTWATSLRALSSTDEAEVRMGLVNWPIWPSRWVIVIGLVAMLIVSIVNMVRTISGKEVLGVDHQMPDVTVHPFEYTREHPPVGLSDAEAAQIANVSHADDLAPEGEAEQDARPRHAEEGGDK